MTVVVLKVSKEKNTTQYELKEINPYYEYDKRN